MEDTLTAAPEIDSAIDTSVDESAPPDFTEDSTASAENTEENGEVGAALETPVTDTDQAANFRPIENGKLSAPAKAAIEKLKVENPQLAKAVQRALFLEDRVRRELPGGFDDIKALRGKIEELGGDDGIQEVQRELSGFREFDKLFSAGDVKSLDFLLKDAAGNDNPEGISSFLQLAPEAFNKFSQLNPEGFAAYVSQVFVADMQASGIPLLIERLQDFIPADNPRAVEAMKKLADYVNRIGGIAAKPVNAPRAKAPESDTRAQDLQRREQEFTAKEWFSGMTPTHTKIYSSEWKQVIGSRTLNDEQKAAVGELYTLRLQAIMKAKPDIKKNLDKFLANGDKAGFNRYLESFYRDNSPTALRKAAAAAGIGAKPGPKPGTPGTPKPAVKPAVKPAAPSGYAPIAQKPERSQVDPVATTSDLWLSGKAVLRDGRKVTWAR